MSKSGDVGNSGDVEWTEEKRMKLYETVSAILDSKSSEDEQMKKILDTLGVQNSEIPKSENSNFVKEFENKNVFQCIGILRVLLKVFKTFESKILGRKLMEYEKHYEKHYLPILSCQKKYKIALKKKSKSPEDMERIRKFEELIRPYSGIFEIISKRLEEMEKMREWIKKADDLANSEFLEDVQVAKDVMGFEIQKTLDLMFGFQNGGGDLENLKTQMLLKTDKFFAVTEAKIEWMKKNLRQIMDFLKDDPELRENFKELPSLYETLIGESKLSRDGLMVWFGLTQESEKVQKSTSSESTSSGEMLKKPASSEDIQKTPEANISEIQDPTPSKQLLKAPETGNPEHPHPTSSEGIPKIPGPDNSGKLNLMSSEGLLKVPETKPSGNQDSTSSEQLLMTSNIENPENQEPKPSELIPKTLEAKSFENLKPTSSEGIPKFGGSEISENQDPTSSEEAQKSPEDPEIQKLEKEAAKRKKKYQKRKEAKKAKKQNSNPPEKSEILKKAGFLKKSENWKKKTKHQKTSEYRVESGNFEKPKSNFFQQLIDYYEDVIDQHSVKIAEGVVELVSDDEDVKDSEPQEPKITDLDVRELNNQFKKRLEDVRDINELSVIMKSYAFLIMKYWTQEDQRLAKISEIQKPQARIWLPKVSKRLKSAGKNDSEFLEIYELKLKEAHSEIDRFLEKHSKNQLISEYSVFKKSKDISLNYATTEFENALDQLFGENSENLNEKFEEQEVQ
ncbi:hypothetical protein B9Z55_027052 [Caenorhabditis nigoni]|uniref:Uncharacterized protein n=1 Tax=Caenorhabditis nigoni TaxID=1611254 RepID=A0A2G5SIL5_9PELO|nr:hypothetical protein B9Z55_027052 [Caenorhabditis nigoni]